MGGHRDSYRRIGFALALAAAACAAPAEPSASSPTECPSVAVAPPPPPAPPAPVTIATAPPKETRLVLDGAEVHQLASKSNGRSYEIVVGPPYKPEPGKKFATVYVLDGYWDFPLVNAMRGSLHYDQVIPDIMIVGIGYTGKTPGDPDIQNLRASDYTPTANPAREGSGKGPEFLRFIETELFPFIEARYPSDSEHRVISGSSFGGLLALYALLEKPELFYGYVAITPGLRWDDQWLPKRQREHRKVHPTLNERLFIALGGDEEAEVVRIGRAFMKQMEESRYKDLSLRTRVIEGERHAAVKNEAYNRGLRYVLAPLAPKPSK
jgi:predicted alpha/beta superfamily hydrolase